MTRQAKPKEKIDPAGEERAQRVLARAFMGIHHVPGWSRRKAWGNGVSVTHWAGLSSFDHSYLTRLVIAAHDEAVRVDIIGCAPGYLRIGLSPRVREGDIYDRHPTIEEAIEKMRAGA